MIPSYVVATTTNSILSSKPPELQKMIHNSFLTSQMSFFNLTSKKKKKDKVKEALNSGVKAFMNATLTPRLFSQDSQHSINSENSLPDGDAISKPKSKKSKWQMFSKLRGKAKQNDDLSPKMSSFPSNSRPPKSAPNISESEESLFKWGKERKVVRSRQNSSPIEMFDAHLNDDPNIAQETPSKGISGHFDKCMILSK